MNSTRDGRSPGGSLYISATRHTHAESSQPWRGRYRSAQGVETAATLSGPEAVVEQSQRPHWRCHHVLVAAGMDLAASHDLRHCEVGTMWPCDKHAPWTSRRRARGVDSDLAVLERVGGLTSAKSYSRAPLLEPVILANKRAQRRPQEAALGVIHAGWWTQEVAKPAVLGSAQHRLWACPTNRRNPQEVANEAGAAEHPFCLKCEPPVLGSARHRLWGLSSLP